MTSPTVNVDYDADGDNELSISEMPALLAQSSFFFEGDVKIVHVPRLRDDISPPTIGHDPDLLGYVYHPRFRIIFVAQNEWTDNPKREFVAAEDFWGRGACKQMARAITHEFGHLMSISTREPTVDFTTGGTLPTGGHDNGKCPYGTLPLMLEGKKGPQGRWIRHEDWQKANDSAAQFAQ